MTPRVFLLLLLLPLCASWARAQGAVSVLKAEVVRAGSARPGATAGEHPFRFERNLIFFSAELDGRSAQLILDTGAPGLLVNNHGRPDQRTAATVGLGAGGAVSLTNQKIESLSIGERDYGRWWALGLDLRSLESRTGQRIDGFVGHDLLRRGELRIDYPGRTFSLRRSRRAPTAGGRAPRAVLPFEFVGHLPVVTLQSGGRRLRFAVDTGAGTSLVDPASRAALVATGGQIDIQGLDGQPAVHDLVGVELAGLPAPAPTVSFAAMDLSHLRAGRRPIDGIIGSDLLASYVVGIDYRRRKIYLW